MNYVQRRLVSTVAARLPSVSPASVGTFPPTESLKTPGEAFNKQFDPANWASLQPAPSTALVAFAHRIGLAPIFDSPDAIRQACTHPSFLDLFRQHYPSKPEPKTNAQAAAIGNSLLGLFATEYLHAKYPYLPTRVMKAAVSAHVGPLTCDSVAREMGAAPLLRWSRNVDDDGVPQVLQTDAMASIPRSLTGLIYQERSLADARTFAHKLFLTRQVDLRPLLKFSNPKKALLDMVRKYNREDPKSRLLKETGRFSNSPVYVVGIFSGVDKLGEGFGASLRMAEYRAAEDALLRVYLTQTPADQLQLPSTTFPAVRGNIFTPGPEGAYTAPELVNAEVLYESSGKATRPQTARLY